MSESAPKATIIVDVDAQGVTTGVNAAKKELKDLGNAAKGIGSQFEDAGKQAERGFDGIEKKAVATERTTKALVNQLKNSIIDLKTAGDAASKYELRAIDKGIPASVYAPYVAQLRSLQIEQAAVAASAAAASNSIARTITPRLNEVGMTAKATAAALRSVPAQFTDIVVSLQGGQAPLTVLLQQGGQLKDMFGGVGEAARALGGYIKGLINPYTVAAAAVGSLYLAYSQGAAETEAFNKALILSGNQAGTTAVKLSAMAQSVSASTGSTVGAAAAALATLAGTSGIATAQFEKISAVAIGMEKTTGKAVAETVKQFVELGKSPVDASVKLNESTNYLTLSVYEQIKALEEQGRTLEAGVVAQNAYADAMTQRIPQLVDNLGYAEAAWKAIAGEAKKAWDNFLGIGRTTDPVAEMSKNIASAQAKLQMRDSEFKNAKGYDRVGTGADLAAQQKIVDGLLQEQDALLEIERIKGRSNTADAERKVIVDAKAAFDKRGEAYLDKAAKMQRALNVEIEASRKLLESGAITYEEYAKRLNDIQAQFTDKPKRPRVDRKDDFADFMRDMDKAAELADRESASNAKLTASEKFRIENMYKLAKLYKEREISSTQLAAAEARLNAVADKAAGVERIQAQVKAQELLNEQRKKELLAMAGSVTKLEQKAQAAEDEIAMYGKGAEAIEALSIARLQENRDIVAGFGASQEMLALLDQEIDARKRIAKATDTKKGLDENKRAAEKAADEWQKAADKIEDSITDALMRGFESGKGFADVLRDTVVNMFKTMVLRPVISAAVQPLAQSLAGSVGGTSGGGMGSFTSLFTNFDAGLTNTMSGGVQALYNAGFDQLGDAAASLSNSVIKASNSVGGFSQALSYANALNTAFSRDAQGGKDYGKAAGQALGTYLGGPIGSFIGGEIGSALGLKDYSGTYHSGGTGAYSADGGLKYGATSYSFGMGASEYTQGANEQSAAIAMAVSGIIDTASTIAGSDKKSFVGTGYADDISPDGAWGGLMIKLGDQLLTDWGRGGDKWPGREFADGAEGQKQYLDAIAQDVRKAIDTIGLPEWASQYIDALGEGAGLEGLAQALEKIKLTEAAFVTLGDVFVGLADLSDGAKNALLKVSGGMEALAATASSYYTNFYTGEEKAARLTAQTAEAFAKLGLVMPAINDATRSNYRALIDELAAKDLSIEANAKAYAGALSLQGAMNELAPAFTNAAKAANEAFGASANTALAALKRSVDAQREIYQVQVDAAQEAVSEIQGIFDTLDSSIKTLYGQVESAQSAAQGKAFIANAASVAQRTGYLPDAEALSSAISAAMSDGTAYASQAEADFAKLELAGTLGVLQSASGKQLTAAEKQLDFAEQQIEKLDRTLEIAQAQLDAAMGIDNSVLSVVEALAEMNDALRGMIGAIISLAQAGQISPADTAARIAGSSLQKDTWSSVETATGMQSVYASLGGAAGVATKAGVDIYAKDNTKFTDTDAVKHITARLNSGTPELLYTDAIRTGVSAAAIDALMGWTAGTSNQWAQENDLPKFAQGINRVPYDMTARIHKDEAVVPAAFNPYNPNAQQGGNSNARLEGLVEGLTKEVQRLQSIVNDGNKSNERIASTLSDVTEGGSNMRTVAV